MADVEFQNISKSFRDRKTSVLALDRLQLRVQEGELLVMVGPSGCGKTTTLRLVAGLEAPTEGDLRIGGRSVLRVSPKDRDVAMVFQSYALYPHLSVYDNVAFGLKMRATPKPEIQRRVMEIARRLRMESLLHRKPGALSGGEQQRVALARAIVRRPNVFLFDEPLSNLDISLRLHARTEIRTLHRELGITTLHVTHDQEEAMILGDRIAVMRAGRLQQCAPPMEVYERPANLFVAGFIGSPPMNFLRGRLRADADGPRFESALGRFRLSGCARESIAGDRMLTAERDVLLGLRPEHVAIEGNGSADALDPSGEVPSRSPVQTSESLRGRVTLVEPLGDRVHVHVILPTEETVIVRTAPEVRLSPGESARVRLDLFRAHLFDAADSQA